MRTYFCFNVATDDGKILPHTYFLDNPVSFVKATETLYMNDCFITEIGVEPFDDEKYEFSLCDGEVIFTDAVFNADLAIATAPIEHRTIEKKTPLFEEEEEEAPAPIPADPMPAPAPAAPTRPTAEAVNVNDWYDILQSLLANPTTERRCF